MLIEEIRNKIHNFYVMAQADGLDEAAFEDKLVDLIIEQQLIAVEEYQFPEEKNERSKQS